MNLNNTPPYFTYLHHYIIQYSIFITLATLQQRSTLPPRIGVQLEYGISHFRTLPEFLLYIYFYSYLYSFPVTQYIFRDVSIRCIRQGVAFILYVTQRVLSFKCHISFRWCVCFNCDVSIIFTVFVGWSVLDMLSSIIIKAIEFFLVSIDSFDSVYGLWKHYRRISCTQ